MLARMLPSPDFPKALAPGAEALRVLLVEDDPIMVEIVGSYLRRIAFTQSELHSKATLAGALKLLARMDIDLVIADLHLPDSAGAATIGALVSLVGCPVIAITSDLSPTLRDATLACGAYDFLHKSDLSEAALARLVRLAAMQARTFRSLRESEGRLRAILDNEPQCVKLLDCEGRLIEMNPAGLRMIEADSLEALRGHCVYGLVVEEHRDAFRDMTQRVARGEESSLEFEMTGLRGGRRWLETRAVPLRDDVTATQLVLCITRDITERRGAEAALRESEARFRALTELSSDWYWEQDAELRFVRTAGASDARGGITAQAHVGLRRWELPRTEIVSQSWDEHRRVLEARQPFHDLLLRRKAENGEVRYISVDGRPIFGAAGVFAGYRGVTKDVTSRMASELALRESEARFRSLSALTSDWFWETDREHCFVQMSSRITAITGLPAQAYVGRPRWEAPGLSPTAGDWTAHRDTLARRESFRDFELIQAKPDGTRCYLQISGEPVYDADGSFVGYRGAASDITKRKTEENELRRFRAALDAAPEPVLLVDARSGAYVDFNEAACHMFGYSRDELLAMPVHHVRVDRTRERLLEDYKRLEAEQGSEVLEIGACRRKDGSVFPVEFNRRVMETSDGPIVVATVRDLTERLKADQRQAAVLKYQERVARFGQSALAQRQPAELIERAVQAVLEALGAEAVAYVEPQPGAGALVARALVGVADAEAQPGTVPCPAGSPMIDAMHSGSRAVVDGDRLPFPWARGLRSTALLPVRGENGVRGLLCAGYKTANAFAAEQLNFAEAVASVLSTALQRIDSENRLAYLAQFDPLTGLANRTLLADRFSQMIVQAKRHGAPLAVLFIDLDGFKTVNDTLGHAGGDALLKEVAVRLQATVRSGDTVARISGDEFAVVLADLARLEDAALVAQKVIDRLAATVDIAGKEVFVTASVGIAAFPGDGADADTLIGAADAAMYRAKQSGRNTFQFFTAEINQRSRARAHMGAELRRALEREEFALVYQPKVDLATRRTTGAEALLRWKHPERGLVSPMEFIPVLEETGLIVPVGDWVLRRACEDLKAWQAAGHAVVPVAVNLSARQFRRGDLDSHIRALVAAVGIDASLIELEITESQLMQDPAHAIRVMRALRDAGMSIAIDDFGTGYSSLAYLNRFPVSALKIDRSFVKDMAKGKDDATLVRTIIEMAHSLGFTVIAEGVETEEQATFLRLLRCELAQGYLFAKPMPAAEFVRLLAKR